VERAVVEFLAHDGESEDVGDKEQDELEIENAKEPLEDHVDFADAHLVVVAEGGDGDQDRDSHGERGEDDVGIEELGAKQAAKGDREGRDDARQSDLESGTAFVGIERGRGNGVGAHQWCSLPER